MQNKSNNQNLRFLASLYNEESLEEVEKWFDKLGGENSFSRKKDDSMSLDKFVNLIFESSPFITLQICWTS